MWQLTLTKFWREKNQTDVKILFFAMLVAIFAISFQAGTARLLHGSLIQEAESLLGARALIDSPQPLPKDLNIQAQKFDLEAVNSINFITMVIKDEEMSLATVATYASDFPLLGKLKIENLQGTFETNQSPPTGEIWAEQSLLDGLDLQLGDRIDIGIKTFILSGIIRNHPIASSRSSFFAPKVYANFADIEATKVLGPGARASYRLFLNGTDQAIEAFKASQAENLQTWQWITPQKGRLVLDEALQVIERYLSLIVAIQVLLAALAIVICANHYQKRCRREVAIWRAIGAKQAKVLWVTFFHLTIVTLLALIFGLGLSAIAQHYLIDFLKVQFSLDIPLQMNTAWEVGTLVAMVLLVGFIGWPLYQLKNITPVMLLKKMRLPKNRWLDVGYLLSFVVIMLILFYQSFDFDLVLRLFGQLFILASIAYVVAWGAMAVLYRVSAKGPITWRLAMANINRKSNQSQIQWVLFTTVIMIALLVQIMRVDFLQIWQNSLPTDTPNYFIINIDKNDVPRLKKWFAANDIQEPDLYPIVRARLTHINQDSVRTEADPEGRRGLRRAINLTWLDNIADDTVVLGPSWQSLDKNKIYLSLEENFAKRRALNIGDTLSFEVAGQTITGEVAQFRQVNWQSFTPNFFVIFSPNALENSPHTYMTSVYVKSQARKQMHKLPKTFLGVSLIDIDEILNKTQALINQAVVGVSLILGLVLILGFFIMYALILVSIRERLHESALLQVFGASKKLIFRMLAFEFLVMGIFSGTVGALLASIIAVDIDKFFNIHYAFDPMWLIIGFMIGIVLFVPLGMLATRKVFQVSGHTILRQETI